ncbi:MAG: glycosyltransferase family 1 protein [Oceanospirillaceae bacterium]|nr:glycosyltransferase family 1 protein [Oceanospirillaceae bacterium]MCP5335518.1 glycosyltransferase family 1 protein [Oceanospirillaceae bacterium]MCP5349989.1 glycosyltransferase family 1 protein [Oceanospirillaceae bacterium]
MEIKRICIVTETFSPEINGVANTLNHLVQGLRDKAIQVQIIRPQHPAGANEEAGLHTDWVRSMSIPGYSELRMGLPTQREVKRQLQAFDPQVIYVATEGPLGFVAVKAARKLNIPVLSGFHTNFHQYFRHYHLGLLTPLAYRYLRYFHNKTQGTIVPTQEQAAELTRVGFANMQVLSRGVNAALFNPQKRDKQLRRQWGLDDEDVAVIYVGRLAAEKNIALAIESFRQMKHEDVRVKLIMVGDGPLAEKLADENPGVIFTGAQRGEDLARHYASADIFLFPSLTDTFGNVVLEAMASGLAVVAFDYAAARSNIQSDENGILIPFADEGRFAERSQSLVDQPNLLRQIRHKARQHAETLRWEAIVEQFTRQLRGIITGDMQNGSVKKSVTVS